MELEYWIVWLWLWQWQQQGERTNEHEGNEQKNIVY